MLEVESIRKRLGAALALDDCSLSVRDGERVAIFGANGAGKSTLLKIVAGVLRPDAGAVYWRKQALTSGPCDLRQKIGYVPEAADPPPHLSVGDLLSFVAGLKTSEPLSSELVTRLALDDLIESRIAELSLGQRRRVCLAAALTGEPELLILDEPSNGLDADSLAALVELLLARPTTTVLMATHDNAFADAVGTRRIDMRSGRVLSAEN